MEGASLEGAHLRKADLTASNLRNTNMKLANLQDAVLTQADLTGASKLTLEQFGEVKSLFETKLDTKILDQINDLYPELLQETDSQD
jgi:uncharacterized protein YjbI with pentapeptide repeats